MAAPEQVPILLLKTKSTPVDAYEELLQKQTSPGYDPIFVPVLEHQFDHDGLSTVTESLAPGRKHTSSYGGLIFTSQRAVEAFAKIVSSGQPLSGLGTMPVYSVGPATTRALKAIPYDPPLQVFGEHTGDGDNLAKFILQHYGEWYRDSVPKPPLLFMVGDKRRDIIPKTLMDPNLLPDKRIEVTEVVVYRTGTMTSFARDFAETLRATAGTRHRWVVVFSPTGCGEMLQGLGLGSDARGVDADRTTFVATIGPTTQRYLVQQYGYNPDVCAKEPSPEGILRGIASFAGTEGTTVST